MDITSVFGTAISGSSPDRCTQRIIVRNIPQEVIDIVKNLQENGFEAQIVGGSVRDLFLGLDPKDWDINTNALPDQILSIFPDSFYENEYGTVGIKIRKNVSHETKEEVEIVEVTPYRKEGIYTDGRHPESVSFTATLEDDLKRRDFTVNSASYDPIKDILFFLNFDNMLEKYDIYNYKGHLKDILNESIESENSKGHFLQDIKDKVIRAVGEPKERFEEDYLRMLRAVRIANQLGFTIEKQTEQEIINNSSKLSSVSRERVRDELIKIFMTQTPMIGFLMLDYTQLIQDILPELLLGKGMKQTENHKYDVYGHLLRSMQHAADKEYTLEMRIASLLHDIAKPHTARLNKKTGWNSFHGHEVVGAKVSRETLNTLKFPQDLIEKVCILVRWHMFNSDPDQVTMSAVRRMIVNVGRDNIWDLMNLRFCDRIGSGRPVEEPLRLRRYFAMIEEALTQPTDLKMLKVDGKVIMEVTRVTPGPKIGLILKALMGEVLENPKLNLETTLETRAIELANLEIGELRELANKGEEEIEEKQEADKKQIRKKFKVT